MVQIDRHFAICNRRRLFITMDMFADFDTLSRVTDIAMEGLK
jgi:hypothetical protein